MVHSGFFSHFFASSPSRTPTILQLITTCNHNVDRGFHIYEGFTRHTYLTTVFGSCLVSAVCTDRTLLLKTYICTSSKNINICSGTAKKHTHTRYQDRREDHQTRGTRTQFYPPRARGENRRGRQENASFGSWRNSVVFSSFEADLLY